MAITETGLRYVSDGVERFIRGANESSLSVNKFNRSLLELESTYNNFERSLKSGSKDQLKYAKSGDTLTVQLNKTSDSIKNQNNLLLESGKSYENADKNIDDFNKTQKEQIKLLDKSKEVLLDNKEAIIGIAGTIKGFKDAGKEDTGIIGTLFNAKKLRDLLKLWGKLPPQIKFATAAIATFAGVAILTEGIGGRSAGLTAISEAFDNLSRSANLSTTYLEDFTAEADNQLTQAQSLTLINKALAGSVGEFQTELADSLPTLLEFARVRAAATGEDVDFLFESLIQGIKKGQPLILDNLGLVVKLEETYESYAKSLNKTASSLSAVEKQQALLQSVNKEAIRNIGILGEATLSNADKISARANIISDILDNISLAVQPLLGSLLDIQLSLLNTFQGVFQPFIDILNEITYSLSLIINMIWQFLQPLITLGASVLKLVVEPFRQAFRIFSALMEVIVSMNGPVKNLTQIFLPLAGVLDFVATVIARIGDVLVGLITFFRVLGEEFVRVTGFGKAFNSAINKSTEIINQAKKTINDLAIVLAYGLGSAFASLVNTAAKAARNILKVIADMAQGIADFLIGESPPPKGPLSNIDTGGQKTFEAWLDGFTNVSLRPVKNVLDQVNKDLGEIGSYSLEKVERRLTDLDLALRPFSEQLEIAQSRFEALSAPAEAALRAIDRQLDTAVEALTKGDATAKASVQALDAQRAAIQKNLELQQQQVDFAQIELALKKGQQAEERALLNIQKKRLGGQQLTQTEKMALSKGSLGSASGSEKSASGSGDFVDSGSEIVSQSEKLGESTGNVFADAMFGGLGDNLNFALFDEIGTEQERLVTQGGRLLDGLGGLPDKLAEPFTDIFGPEGKIATTFNDFFGENGLVQNLFKEVFGEDGFVENKLEETKNFFNNLWGEEGSLVTGFNSVFGSEGSLSTTLTNFFGEGGTFRTKVAGVFGEESFWTTQLNTAADNFITFKDDLYSVVQDMIGFFSGDEDSIEKVFQSLFGEEGTITTLIVATKTLFTDFYNSIFGDEGLFSKIGGALQQFIASPIFLLLTAVQDTINAFITGIEDFINGILTKIDTNIIQNIPENLRGPLGNLSGLQVDLGTVQFPLPAINIGQAPQAATGGLFTGGLLSVGEKGQEFVAPASKVGVFPNNFVTAIQSLESVLASSMFVPNSNNISNNQTYNNNNMSQTFNINQPISPTTMRQQFNQFGG